VFPVGTPVPTILSARRPGPRERADPTTGRVQPGIALKGDIVVAYMQPDAYTVKVSLRGFNTAVLPDVEAVDEVKVLTSTY
jgi:hypothetical protein